MKDCNDELFKGANAKLFEFSRALRKRQTETEEILWQLFRNRQFDGLKFRRQHPIAKYIADFYCHEIKLIIEIDGTMHDSPESKKYDENRNNELKELGVTTLRFTNEDVKNKLSDVLQKIRNCININLKKGPSPNGEGFRERL